MNGWMVPAVSALVPLSYTCASFPGSFPIPIALLGQATWATLQPQKIFFHRVEELAWENPSYALGCAIAHELGHLLLGYDRRNGSPHSASGLMRGPWQRDDLKPKARETMQFTPEDAARLRSRILERSNKSNDLQAPPPLFTEIDRSDPGLLVR